MGWKHHLINLVYPPLCIACSESTEHYRHLFCPPCLEQIALLDPTFHCPVCFRALEAKQQVLCGRCSVRGVQFAAAFEMRGPIAVFVRQFIQGKRPEFARAAVAWMVAQHSRLDWPLPDAILPLPTPFLLRWLNGYAPPRLLAQALGSLWGVPIVISPSKTDLADQTLLIVDVAVADGSALNSYAAQLQGALPKKVYGMALATLAMDGGIITSQL